MPMSQHRPALAAILVAFVAVLTAFTAARPAAAAPTQTSSPVVDRALQDVGTYQGECWQWMKKVIFEATGAEVGFDYRWGYLDAGATEVSILEAGPGDIIQIADDNWTEANADYNGLHTAIIISNNGDGTFEAIDSNQNWDGVVNLRSRYDPAAAAGRYGLNFHIYRFSGEGAAPPAPPARTEAGPVTAGDKARVNTPGDCLRLRSGPAGNITHCLGHGTQVTITGEPQVSEGIRWAPVSTAAGKGWMAESFLLKEVPTSSAALSGTGSAKPVFQYRAFVIVATD